MKRSVPLRSTTPLTRSPMPRPRESRPKRTRPVGQARSGWSEPKVIALVDARDGTRCQACGRDCPDVFSRQHRIARGAGGSSRPEVHGPANRVRLCGSATSPGCHLLCEQRDPEMAWRGFWLPRNSTTDPATVPIKRWDGAWVYLTDEGTYREASK